MTNRKDQHVDLAESFYHQASGNDFDQLRFIHHSLTNADYNQVSLATKIGPFDLDTPFYINGMTGGSQKTKAINRSLAQLAKTAGLAMGSGSVSAALKDPSVRDSFTVIREENPDGLVFANLGAEHSLENARLAVDLLDANALQIHINRPQELVMPEGSRSFDGWLENIATLQAKLAVPLIVKEVGFGMSQETIKQLASVGVTMIDVAGKGGTNFVAIENARREKKEFTFLEDWGQTTVQSLLEASVVPGDYSLIASGGIRSPFDLLKAYALGAKSGAIAGHFLHLILNEGLEATVAEVNSWKHELTTMMTLLGAHQIADLTKTDILLSPALIHWATLREIPTSKYAKRSHLR